MRKKTSRKLLNRSFAWIRDHLYASNLDVPDELVGEWIFEHVEDKEPKPAGFFFSVFAFGYLQRQVLTSNLPLSQPRSVPLSQLTELFGRWQLKLALAELHNRTDIEVEPMPLFGFPEGEEIKYWPRRSDANTAAQP